MKIETYVILVVGMIFPLIALAQSPEPVSLFDGKTLAGWNSTEGVWRVEDGAITAGSYEKKFPRNEFVSTKKTYANFDLKLRIKCSGDPKTGLINSGIQVRSARLPNGRVAGYQVDCGAGWFGKIYDEHRRKLIYPTPVDEETLVKGIDIQGWNDYRILAEGPRIQVWINGIKASDYTETNPLIPLNGIIAPQIHGGGHVVVQFKDVTIRELPATAGAPTWESLGGADAALAKLKPKRPTANPKNNATASNKIPTPPKGSDRVTFDFETGDLQGWYVAEGGFAHLVANNQKTRGGRPMNQEGAFYLGTLEVSQGGKPSDKQMGIIESPVFRLSKPKMTFVLSGGSHANTRLGLYTLDGKEVRKASASNSETFVPKTWNAPELVGKPVFLRLIDKNTKGWGHITVDAFSAQATLLPEETKKRQALARPGKATVETVVAAAKPAAKPKPKRPTKKMQSARSAAWSPAEQQAGFTVPDDFVIELVASEQHGVINPIDLAFDDAGRLWTQTAQMYPLDPLGELGWRELLAIMEDEERQKKHPEFQKVKDLYQLKEKGRDKILILDDPSKTASAPLHVWADGLSIPQSILPYKDGAYVCHGSELFFLKDSNGDGTSDTMEPVLTGFGYTDTHTMSHLLIRGPGRYIHFSQGALNKSVVTSVASGFKARVDASCQVRFGLDHQEHEVIASGPSNMWGLQLRARGQWYGMEANDRGYCVIPWEHGTAVTGAAFHPMRPYQPLLPELHKFRVGGTGLSGLEFSEDTEGSFPFEAWKNVALMANPITSSINAVRVHRNADGTVESEHLADFLTSKDDWFRPVNIEFGPDGCLYIADFYNKVISHNELSRNHPDRDKTLGRIWRIRHESQAPRKAPDMTNVPADQLVAHLAAPSLWQKRAAWHQIADRGLVELAPPLLKLAGDIEQDVTTRIHALWTLEELDKFNADLMDILLASEDDDLRREAVRSLSSFDLYAPEVAERLRPFLDDPNCMVRSQAIRTLGDLRSPDPAVLAGLITACKPSLGKNGLGGAYERNFERFLARMALERFPAELKTHLEKSSEDYPAMNLLWAIQALDDKAKSEAFINLWSKTSDQALDSETFIAIAGILGTPNVYKVVQPTFQDPAKAEEMVGLALVNQSRVQSKQLTEILTPQVERLLQRPETRALGLQAVSRFNMSKLGPTVATLERPKDTAEYRLLLAAQSVNPNLNADKFKTIANDQVLPFDLRAEAAHALIAADQKTAHGLTTSLLSAGDADQKSQLISLFTQSKAGSIMLCAMVKQKVIQPENFDRSAAERLFQSHPGSPYAKEVIGFTRKRVAEQRKKAGERIEYLTSFISKYPGDPSQGKAAFTSCLTCHKVGGAGQNIAPPLDGSGHRKLHELLTAIVDPDAAVEGSYGLYRVTKTDGSVVEGYLDKKEALGSTVALMGGVRIFVPRAEIKKESFVGGRSFMPAAFGQMPDSTIADLVAYIATLKGEPTP